MGVSASGPAHLARRFFAFLALSLACAAAPSFAATLTVLVDTDNLATTGCSDATPNGPFGGVERRFVTTVDTTQNPPQVTGITREDCTAAPSTFSAPVSVSAGGWTVGVGNGTGGTNVIETGLPIPGPGPVRIGVVYTDPAIGSDATTVSAGGGPIIVFTHVPGHQEQVPTLSDAMLALLVLLMLAVGWKYGRHAGAAPMAMVALVMVSMVAWAAILLDGQIGDWFGIPPAATDPVDADGADINTVFATVEGTTLFVRVDARTGMPPAAVADSYTAVSGTPLAIVPPAGLLDNDSRGVPAATVTHFGGGSLGGTVTSNLASGTATFGVGGSLTVNAAGGFTYTPATGFTGAFTFSYRITNLNGTSDAVVTINTQSAPAITSANATSFNVGTAGTFTVTATGFPAPTLSMTGALPAGVTFNAGTGVLSGVPGAGTAGSYPLVFTATNGVAPNATQNFTLTVNQTVAITSANAATFTAGTPGTFTITTSATPVANLITITGALPSGVSLGATSGTGTAVLSGTPDPGTGGTYTVTITASNGGVTPNGTQSFTLTVNEAPTITSVNAATFLVGTAGTHTVVATGFPAPTRSVTGVLPNGVTFTAATGVLAGIPAAGTAGAYPLTFTAANGVGTDATQNFTLTVQDGVMITSAAATTFVAGSANSFTVTTSGTPPATSVTAALPAIAGVGFTDNGATGTLAGNPGPGTGGVYNFTINATNGVPPNATQNFALTINEAPAITSANAATFTVGVLGTFTVTALGFPAPTFTVTAGTLPTGVTLNPTTGALSGIPAGGTGGTHVVTITAANGIGTAATQVFTLTVNQAPAITSANATTFTVGTLGSFTATATGFPAPAVSFSGVPVGIGVGAVGAVLSGTPTAGSGGVYNGLLVTATNGVGANATQPFTLTINEAPTITSLNNATFQVGVLGTFTVTASGFPAPTFGITAGALPTGVLLDTNTGVISGVPAAGSAAGSPYVITLSAANGVGTNGSQVFTLTVTDPAVAVDDGYNVVHDAILTVPAPGVLANDTGSPAPAVVSVNGVPANVGAPTATTNGTVTLNADGSFSYTPNPDTAGPDSFTYGIQNTTGSDTGTVTITVTNALPVVDLNGPAAGIDTAPVFTEGGGAVAIVDAAQLTVADTDDTNLTGATVQLTNLLDVGSETIAVACPGLAPVCVGGINVADVDITTPGTILITSNAPLADYQTLLRTLTYNNASATPNGTVRDVAVTVNDGIADNNPVAHALVSVAGVNNAPVLAAIEGAALAYSVSAPAAAITATLTVADADSPNLAGATVQITANCVNPDDVLGFTNQAGISGVYTAATCLMTLSGSSSVANYQAALRSVTYQNANLATSTATRTVSFRVNDGAGVNNLSNIATRDVTVAVNTAPVVNAGGTLNYTENDAPTAIDTTVTVTDPDSPNLIGATVQITGNCTSTEDVLAFTTQNGITGVYAGGTCTMTLSGSSSVANYQTALRSVQYSNASENPTTTARTVTWQVNDGGAVNNLSNTPTSTINVAAANDAPVLTAGATASFTEDGPAVVVDGTVTVTDPDSTNLASATVQITANCTPAEDVLAFTNQGGITGTYTAGTCTMALSGSATLATYQAALRTITYGNTSQNPLVTARTVTWTGNDGALASIGVTSTINVTAVNDAPVLANLEVAALPYTENAAATAITSTLTISDVDSTNLTGATVQITGNCTSGQDVLAFTNALGITGSYTAATCLMTLTGTTTLANYQTALRSVTYSNSSDNPSTLARMVSFQVNDGGAVNNLSNTLMRGITVAAVNDPPIANGFTNLPAQAGIPITYPAGKLGGSDPGEGTAVTIVTTPDTLCSGCALTINADGSFTFTPPPLAAATTVSFTYHVTDSGSPGVGVNSAAATVSFTVAGPAIFFVKNPAVGAANCTLGNECLFATAITDIGVTTNANIFVSDANSHTAGSTLRNGGTVIGQGIVADFDTFFGIAAPAEGTLAARPVTSQPVVQARPTVTAAGGTTLTLAQNNTLRGFNLGNTAGAGLAGTTFGTLTLNEMLINTSGQAINLNSGTLAATLDSVTSAGGTNNIALTGVATSGTATLGSGALSAATSNAFAVSGQNGSFSYGGTISNTTALAVSIQSKTGGTVTLSGDINPSAAARGILVQNNNTGTNTITFSGTLKRISSGTNAGVTLATNTGATISFTNGGLDIATTSGAGFTATGGATSITVTGTGNVIAASAGPALNVNNTTIGVGGLNFVSLASGAATGNGITLDTTGSTAGLTVTGDGVDTSVGGNGTGGTISGKSGSDLNFTQGIGIYLNNTKNVVLRRMIVNGTNQNFGIRGTLVDGFTLEYSTVNGTQGNAASLAAPENAGEGAIYFGNTTTNGIATAGTLTNNIIGGARARNLSLINTTGTATLTIKGNTFQLNQNFSDANQSLLVEARGGTVNAILGGTLAGEPNTFAGAPSDNVNFTGQTGSTMTVTMRNNTLANSHLQNIIGGGGLTLATQGTMNFTVDGNSINGADGSAVTLFKASAATLLAGTFSNNTIGTSGVLNSGSKSGNGIFVSAGGTGTMTFAITNNTVLQYAGNAAIYADNTGGSYTANFTVTGNTVGEPGAGAFAGLAVTNGSPSSTDTINVCADIKNNDFSAGDPANANDIIVGASGAAAGHTFNLPGYAGGANLANVQTFIQNNNLIPLSTVVTAYTDAPVTAAAFTGTGTSCPAP